MGTDSTERSALTKTLSLKDLVLFGVISIFGSGGFNLIGHALAQGGDYWPLALGAAAMLFLGSSRTYEEAFNEFKKIHQNLIFWKNLWSLSILYHYDFHPGFQCFLNGNNSCSLCSLATP